MVICCPDHPTWCAQDIFSETRHYLGACDVFGGDPYPVSTRPVSAATDAMRIEQKGLMGMRPIWQVVQAFGWNWISEAQANRQRRPSEPEMRNMAWQAIADDKLPKGVVGRIFREMGEEWKLLVNTSSTEAVESLGLAPLGMSFTKAEQEN